MRRFEFAFDDRYLPMLAAFGVTRGRAHVEVDEDLRVRFGLFSLSTPVSNVRALELTGPYRWYRAIGIRMSLADRGLTFGTTVAGGVCLLFRDPVAGIGPFRLVRHPGLTLTVADPPGFAAHMRERAGL